MGSCRFFIYQVLIASIIVSGSISCGGSSSSNPSGSTITLSGSAAFNSSPNVSAPLGLNMAESAAPAGSTVTILKKSPDGTETTVATTTTDASGNYSVSGIPTATTGTGASTDFYYVVKVESGSQVAEAPVAPSGDSTANVNTESTLASKILSDAVDADGDKPTLPADLINNLAKQVDDDLTNLGTDVTVPGSDQTTNTTSFAEAITTTGGNAGTTYQASQIATDLLKLDNDSTATDNDVGELFQRVYHAACPTTTMTGQIPDTGVFVEWGAKMLAGTTYTPTQIVSAFDSGGATSVDTKVASFVTGLQNAENILSQGSTAGTLSSDTNSFYLIAKILGLSSTTFTSTSSLNPGQGLMFLVSLPTTLCNFDGGLAQMAASLRSLIAGGAPPTAPKIEAVEIYASEGFGCTDPGEGAFNATVYFSTSNGSETPDSATITSSDATALKGTGVTLSCSNSRCSHAAGDGATSGYCVTHDSNVSYTITINLSSGSDVVTTTRTHPEVSETFSQYNGTALPNVSAANPTAIDEQLPMFSWTAPDTKLAEIASNNPTNGVPTGSKIKYTYEWSYCNTAASCGSPLTGLSCQTESAGTTLYAVDYFIPTKQCDPAACAAENGLSASGVACRINLQTYLVDEFDSILGQAAGNFRNYCYDSDGDGSCG